MERERERDSARERVRFTTGSQISTIPFQPPSLELGGLPHHHPPTHSYLLESPQKMHSDSPHQHSQDKKIYKIDEEVDKMRKKDKTDRKETDSERRKRNWEYSGLKIKVRKEI
jgi:hypothetical protein